MQFGPMDRPINSEAHLKYVCLANLNHFLHPKSNKFQQQILLPTMQLFHLLLLLKKKINTFKKLLILYSKNYNLLFVSELPIILGFNVIILDSTIRCTYSKTSDVTVGCLAWPTACTICLVPGDINVCKAFSSVFSLKDYIQMFSFKYDYKHYNYIP